MPILLFENQQRTIKNDPLIIDSKQQLADDYRLARHLTDVTALDGDPYEIYQVDCPLD